MTAKNIREMICGSKTHFCMRMSDIRERLGAPAEIRMMTGLIHKQGHQVVLLLYTTDAGLLEIFCPIDLIEGHESVIDGWFGAELTADDSKPLDRSPQEIRGVDHLRGLFD